MKREHYLYLVGVGALGAGLWFLYHGRAGYIPFTSLFVGVVSLGYAARTQSQLRKRQKVVNELVIEKSEIRDRLDQEQQQVEKLQDTLQEKLKEKENLRAAKHRENQRLKNLKRVLSKEGIDTSYLVDKYDDSLYAPVIVLTHFNPPEHNTEEQAGEINKNLSALDSKTLHGATKIIPPRNFDQDLRERSDLRRWFDENVLGGNPELSHRLELLTVIGA